MNGTHAQPPGSHYNDPTSFAGFTFNGNQNLDALAGFYGLATPVLASQVTLAQYLAQVCHGDVRPGFCISVGNAQLVVLDVEEGAISKVGLEFCPRRRPRRTPEAYTPTAIPDPARYIQRSLPSYTTTAPY